MSFFNISIIGIGKIGGALAIALTNNGYKVRQLVSKNVGQAKKIADLIESRPQVLNAHEIRKIDSDVVFITVQDSEIAAVSEKLADRLDNLPFVFHTSGANSSKILFKLRDEGCEVASMHPLVSISDAVRGAEKFENAYFCLEGDFEALQIGKQIVTDLNGIPFSIPTKNKPLYHAAAVTACGHLVSLLATAIKMLSDCGLGKSEAQKILLPLVKSTISNLESQTPSQALTGTFARADVETMQNHIKILREMESPEINQIYLQLGQQSLELAKEQGADSEKIEQMHEILKREISQKELILR